MESKQFIIIKLDHIEEGLELTIDAKVDNTLYVLSDALENGEAEHQLVEGFTYDYELNDTKFSFAKSQIVQPHTRKSNVGTISPNIYVGTLVLPIFKNENEVGSTVLEVRSVKADYRNDYRDMLELITERCTDLLMQANSPVSHNFETDFEKGNETLYQKFAFVKSIIATAEFSESVHRIVSSPVTQWKEKAEQKDIRNIRRFKNSNIKELIRGSNRTYLPRNHYLRIHGLNSLSSQVTSLRKIDTVDTAENRFVKFALETFLKYCSDINKIASRDSRLYLESGLIERELESYLHHSVFRKISHPETLKLNSPVLQRKEGYREILRVWLMFDLAAKLVWKGGDDVYKGGKKDIATLYEYWLFFKLLDLFKSIFDIEPKDISELIKKTSDGLNLQLKQGNHTALKGVFNTGTRKLNIRFNYNRSFSGQNDYPHSGSWTTTMRPDYTLSFWPNGISEKEAEIQELIVHIHFDAKYKIANLTNLLNKKTVEDIDTEKEEYSRGIYKNVDLLKMHAYKDAIRRTGGAYVLYPGDVSITKKGFHEIIPGLGAFPVRPSKIDDGISELKEFIFKVIDHFVNRASQREKMAFRTFEVYKDKPQKGDEVNDAFPEIYGDNRSLIPDDTYVLIGFYKKETYEWIIKNGLYNAKADNNRDSLRLGLGEAGAKYLLLFAAGETKTNRLLKISETGPRIFSKKSLMNRDYPFGTSQDYYLIYKVQEIADVELMNWEWDITKLKKHKNDQTPAFPFSVTMSELMKTKIK